MLKIQQALISDGFLKMKPKLDELKIFNKIFTSPKGKEILLLDYLNSSDPCDKYVKECRGLGLFVDDFSIFRCGFKRFMNYGEVSCDNINFNEPFEVEEKEDGSLIMVSFLPGEGWIVGTRGSIFPTEKIPIYNCTIPESFKKTINWNEKFEKKLDPNCTYCFEFCSMANRVVVAYKQPKVILINIVDNKNLVEFNSEFIYKKALDLGVDAPKVYGFNNIEEIFIELNKVSGIEREGFVIKQRTIGESRYRRIKIKSKNYRELHNIFSCKSLNNLVKMVIEERRDEFNDFPEYLETYDKINFILQNYYNEMEEEYLKVAHLLEGPEEFQEKKKRFAKAIKDNKHKSFLFKKSSDSLSNAKDYTLSRMIFNGIYKKTFIKNLIADLGIDNQIGKQWVIVEDDAKDI